MTQPAASPAEVDDYRAAQAAEYGRYVAIERIYYGGALAYLPGHPVPVSNVEAHGYLEDGLVREVTPTAATTAKPGTPPPNGTTPPATDKTKG